MSHFLARLVERARGTAPRVEPMVAPRFAPGPMTEIATEIQAPGPVPSGETQPAPPNKAPGRRIVRKKIERPRAEETQGEETAAVPAQQMLVPREILVSRSPTSIITRIAPDNVVVPSAANGSRLMESVFEAPVTRPGSTAPDTRRAAVVGIADPGRIGPDRAARRAAIQPNESNAEPPIVRVTIGRIDVRAMPPAVPSRKSTTKFEPKLTLDAYLKSRKEATR